MRVVFAGTPDFAAQHLKALVTDQSFEVVAVYTQPDRPAGRGKRLQPSAVKLAAEAYGLPVEQPVSLKDPSAQTTLAGYQADIMVVVAYGLLLPKEVLTIPARGCINVHGSILPRWRGAAPIQRAIWAGDKESGITIMQMDEGLDTGPMLKVARIQLTAEETSASLYEKMADLGPRVLIDTLTELDQITPILQRNEDATYAHKLSKEEARIDWQRPAEEIERHLRAFTPWPGTEMWVQEERIKVLAAQVERTHSERPVGEILAVKKDAITVQCGSNALTITQVQLPGKKPMAIHELLNARKDMFVQGVSLLETSNDE
ncbi:MAG: methionyl-tRNA formyltransferase Fmt [Idiomarinaceae bacterium HL-53]|nr:MAG: methionyl-tRNA formyltransferase Fmt [Idiomarinaceae bacterium HL-53]CUS47790.1 methionyl-tRNA formyltransferase [Idiomarinaceae bacterium HL-53]